jgi:hypothetical protein
LDRRLVGLFVRRLFATRSRVGIKPYDRSRVELRRHFPGITDHANARLCVRAIAGWQPLPPLPLKPKRTGWDRA